MRNLAHIELIEEVKPIYLVDGGKPADSIELARVLGWWVVVKKGEYKPGDKTVYIEIDSQVPESNEAFAFLAAKKFKVRTMKLNKFYSGDNIANRVISQGLCMQVSIVQTKGDLKPGADVTELLGITKIEDETPEVKNFNADNELSRISKKHWLLKHQPFKFLMRYKWFRSIAKRLFVSRPVARPWPDYIVKTDETRVQAIPQVFRGLQGVPVSVTEKLDGTSTTFGLKKLKGDTYDFAVCSRNVRQITKDQKNFHSEVAGNVYWEMAEKYDVERLLRELFKWSYAKDHVILQGETIGHGIQSNKYQLTDRQFYAFNVVIDGIRLSTKDAMNLLHLVQQQLVAYEDRQTNISWVPVVSEQMLLPETIDELVTFATSKSMLCDTLREGIVIRTIENNPTSFKTISPEFLLKWGL